MEISMRYIRMCASEEIIWDHLRFIIRGSQLSSLIIISITEILRFKEFQKINEEKSRLSNR